MKYLKKSVLSVFALAMVSYMSVTAFAQSKDWSVYEDFGLNPSNPEGYAYSYDTDDAICKIDDARPYDIAKFKIASASCFSRTVFEYAKELDIDMMFSGDNFTFKIDSDKMDKTPDGRIFWDMSLKITQQTDQLLKFETSPKFPKGTSIEVDTKFKKGTRVYVSLDGKNFGTYNIGDEGKLLLNTTVGGKFKIVTSK